MLCCQVDGDLETSSLTDNDLTSLPSPDVPHLDLDLVPTSSHDLYPTSPHDLYHTSPHDLYPTSPPYYESKFPPDTNTLSHPDTFNPNDRSTLIQHSESQLPSQTYHKIDDHPDPNERYCWELLKKLKQGSSSNSDNFNPSDTSKLVDHLESQVRHDYYPDTTSKPSNKTESLRPIDMVHLKSLLTRLQRESAAVEPVVPEPSPPIQFLHELKISDNDNVNPSGSSIPSQSYQSYTNDRLPHPVYEETILNPLSSPYDLPQVTNPLTTGVPSEGSLPFSSNRSLSAFQPYSSLDQEVYTASQVCVWGR